MERFGAVNSRSLALTGGHLLTATCKAIVTSDPSSYDSMPRQTSLVTVTLAMKSRLHEQMDFQQSAMSITPVSDLMLGPGLSSKLLPWEELSESYVGLTSSHTRDFTHK